MTYVVTEACINCKNTDCVDVCPVEAIYAEDEVANVWPAITEKTTAAADAERWAEVKDKRALLETA